MRAIPPITITASNRPIPEAGLPVRTIRTTRSAAMTPITATPNSSFLSMPSFSPTPLRPATQDAQNSAGRCAMRSSEIGADLLTGPQYIYPFFDNKYLGGQKEAGENPARPRHCKRTELVSENVCSRMPLGLRPGKVSSQPQASRPGPPKHADISVGGWAEP